MRNYETGVSGKVVASVLAAVVITAGVVSLAIYFPGIEPTPPVPSSLGARTAEYLNSMRDNVEFYFMANCSFVNENLTYFYSQSEPTVSVDGVILNRTETGGEINVLFAPWSSNIIGQGEITTTQWNSLSGLIIDDGIGQMEEPSSTPDYLDGRDLYFSIYFNDNTCFYIQYCESQGLLSIQNGTWTGEFIGGWPEDDTFGATYWLVEGGHLTDAVNLLYLTITSTASYPE